MKVCNTAPGSLTVYGEVDGKAAKTLIQRHLAMSGGPYSLMTGFVYIRNEPVFVIRVDNPRVLIGLKGFEEVCNLGQEKSARRVLRNLFHQTKFDSEIDVGGSKGKG